MDSSQFLQKYGQIISEEVNVKHLTVMEAQLSVKKLYIPVGTQISSKFGKDTGRIIAAARAGNVREVQDNANAKANQVEVFQGGDIWVLEESDYELRYEGLDEICQSAEGNVIVSLDVVLDDDLIAEGVAREISRFLNQMRKTADFAIDARVDCLYMTESIYLKGILEQYRVFLSDEALIERRMTNDEGQGFKLGEVFEHEGDIVTFSLKY